MPQRLALVTGTASAALIAASLTVPPLTLTAAQAAPDDVAGIETAGPIPTATGQGQARPDLPAGVAVMPRGSLISPVTPQVYAASLADEASVQARVVFLTGGRDAVIHNGELRNGWMTIPTTLVPGGDYEVAVDRGNGTWQRIGTFNVATRSGGVGPSASIDGISVSTVTGEAAWSWTSESLAGSGLSATLAWGSGVSRAPGVPDGWRLAVASGSDWAGLSERGPEVEALRQPGAPEVDRVSDTAVTVSYDYPYEPEAVLLQYRQADGRWRLLANAGESAEDLYLRVPKGPIDVRLGVKSETGTVLWSDAVRATERLKPERPDIPLATAGRNSVATAGDAPAVVTLRGWDGSLLSFVRNDLGVYEQANGSGVPGYVNSLTRESDGVWEFADAQGVVTRFVAGYPVTVSSQGQVITTMEWDAQGRLVSASAGPGRAMTFAYAGSGACPDWTAHGFDAAPKGMLCRVSYPGNAATEIGYAAGYLALIKDPGNIGTTLGWDTLGRLVSTRSALVSQVATFDPSAKEVLSRLEYDAQGRAFALIAQPAAAGAASVRREISFPVVNDTVLRRWIAKTGDPATSRVRLVGTPGYAMSLTYDLDPVQWVTLSTRDAAGLSMQAQADPRTGRLARSVDAMGRAVRYEYDDRGLVTQIKGPFTAGSGTRVAGDGMVTTTEYDTQRVNGVDRALAGLRAQVYSKAQFAGDVSAEFWEAAPGEGGISAAWSGRPEGFSAQAAGVWVPADADDARGAEEGWQFQVRASTDADVSFIIGGVVCVVNKPCLIRGLPKGPKAVTVQVARAGSRGYFTVLAAPAGGALAVIPRAEVGPGYALATAQTTNDIVGGEALKTRYAFDDPASGRPSEVTSGNGLTTSFEYENAATKRLVTRTTPGGLEQATAYWPQTGTASLPQACGNGTAVSSGQPSTVTRQDGTTITHYFDARDRVLATVVGDETTCVTYYPDSTIKTTAVYVPAGLLELTEYVRAVGGDPRVVSQTITHGDAAPVNPGASVTSTSRLDLLGRDVESTSAAGVVTRTTYDALGNPSRVVQTSPTGAVLTFDYAYRSSDGQLETQKINGVTAATLAYDEQTGQLASVRYPDGVRASFGYFGNGQIDSVNVGTTDARFTRISHALSRADSGRISSESLVVQGTAATKETRRYTYDSAGRLTSALILTDGTRSTFDYGFGAPSPTCATSYQAGKDNLRTSGARDGAAYSTCFDASGRLTATTDPALGGEAKVTYDARGRVTNISGARALAMSWAAGTTVARIDETRADGFVRTTFDTYDGGVLDKTVTTNDGASTVRYAGPFLLGVADGEVTGVAATQFALAGGATVVAEAGEQAVLTIPGADGSALLTVAVPSLGAGTPAPTGLAPRFGPYGEPLTTPTSTSPIPDYSWRASSRQETLPGESSITLLGARPYHPWLGIFLAPDPVVDAGNNMYGYTHGDPINQRDSTGNDSETLDWIARGLGIAGLLVGLGGGYQAFKLSKAPGLLAGMKMGNVARWTGLAGAVLGTASTGVQIAAMATQSGSITADQWVVAIGSGMGALACVGATVQGFRIYRSEARQYAARLRMKEDTRAKYEAYGMDPSLLKSVMDRWNPSTMTGAQAVKKTPQMLQRVGDATFLGQVSTSGGPFRVKGYLQGDFGREIQFGARGQMPTSLGVIGEMRASLEIDPR